MAPKAPTFHFYMANFSGCRLKDLAPPAVFHAFFDQNIKFGIQKSYPEKFAANAHEKLKIQRQTRKNHAFHEILMKF